MGLVSLLGCGTAPVQTLEVLPKAEGTQEMLSARGLPGRGLWRMLIIAEEGTSTIELYGLYYGAVASGWRVDIAASTQTAKTRTGDPIPVDKQVGSIQAKDYDTLYIPGGTSVESAALLRGFSGILATTRQGLAMLTKAGITTAATLPETGVVTHKNWLVASQPGDIPGLLHALNSLAEDRLRVRHKATGGHPP